MRQQYKQKVKQTRRVVDIEEMDESVHDKSDDAITDAMAVVAEIDEVTQ